ncbi:hypothetical protein BVRB_010960 [Beta vulgaris subsp. vulgaris]|uniref:Granulins domain-containing protein n=1 Tax=Beta vulgaris subsp. vulgaris TaxID=3555 RepID=A0A0J8B296_BETVV|nr:hypothetical protein BVRB_010960 [Beta vulgaris subsp. vulgaris]
MMKMKKGVDVSMSRVLLIVLLISVIMGSMSSTSTLACSGIDQTCEPYDDYGAECCPGSRCLLPGDTDLVGVCIWCPGSGEGCGFFTTCCPGYTCDSFFSGTCY